VQLINNLDLAVIQMSTGQVFTGNNLPDQQWDVLNNVEQVGLSNQIVTTNDEFYAVVVSGQNIPLLGPQNYSLVVNGNLVNVDFATNCGNSATFCPGNCNAANGGGTCNATSGYCMCNDGFAGSGCTQTNDLLNTAPIVIETDYTQTGIVGNRKYAFGRLSLDAGIGPGVIHLTLTTSAAIAYPDSLAVFVGQDFIPDAANFETDLVIYTNPSSTTSWTTTTPFSVAAVQRVFNFAVYSFCCSDHTYTVTWKFSAS